LSVRITATAAIRVGSTLFPLAPAAGAEALADVTLLALLAESPHPLVVAA
jgi:hypothetical protein